MSPWRMANELIDNDAIKQEELDACSSAELLHCIELKTARYIPERFVHALKAAVIREASVGTVYVARDGTDGCPEFRFRCAESLTAVSSGNVCQLCRELIPERQYVLIPSNLAAKETP